MPQVSVAPWQFLALNNPYRHFAMFGGVATGKTYTGSHWSIEELKRRPQDKGFIGANSYDQLSQATLAEFFYWLQKYGFDFVVDRKPPPQWNSQHKFKDYNNITTIRYRDVSVTVFTRVLSDGNPLRGIEFSWYWLDESRDTPQNTHDIVLSRIRESPDPRGLITTTPNGEDWSYQRFVRNGNTTARDYGSMHVRTEESVNAGIITRTYYDDMRKAYSPMMAAQELDALHVNVAGGRAYYATGEHNKRYRAPWGDRFPNPERPLILGCDFNYSPSPHIWVVGQQGPGDWKGPRGEWGDQCIHWFQEIAHVEYSTPEMANVVAVQFPRFFIKVFGDASGNRGTTSNAGQHDYNQIAKVFADHGIMFTIDADQSNPMVRDRVENLNAKSKNALGQTHMTYNPFGCPNLDADFRLVGWKKTVMAGRAKLDDGGDLQRTHAADGAGYAVWKVLPPGHRGQLVGHIESPILRVTREI